MWAARLLMEERGTKAGVRAREGVVGRALAAARSAGGLRSFIEQFARPPSPPPAGCGTLSHLLQLLLAVQAAQALQ